MQIVTRVCLDKEGAPEPRELRGRGATGVMGSMMEGSCGSDSDASGECSLGLASSSAPGRQLHAHPAQLHALPQLPCGSGLESSGQHGNQAVSHRDGL